MVAAGWTAEELSILRAVALQTLGLTADQVARGWFPDGLDAHDHAARALERLAAAGLVEQRVIEAHPLLALDKPLFVWRPGDSPPGERRLAALAARAQTRWPAPHVAATIYVASKAAARVFGAFLQARRAKHCEATHNLHLAEVFVRYRIAGPRLAEAWLGEAAFPKLGFDVKGMKDPDAFILGAGGRARRIVEFAGSYSVEHLRRFHEHCAGRAAERLAEFMSSRGDGELARLYSQEGTSYELW